MIFAPRSTSSSISSTLSSRMSIKLLTFSILVLSANPALVGGVVPEGENPGDILRLDIALVRRRLGDYVEIGEADVPHVRSGEAVEALFHAVGEDADNAKYYSEQSKKWSEAAENALDVSKPSFTVDLETGHLLYSGGRFDFEVENGHLLWGMVL